MTKKNPTQVENWYQKNNSQLLKKHAQRKKPLTLKKNWRYIRIIRSFFFILKFSFSQFLQVHTIYGNGYIKSVCKYMKHCILGRNSLIDLESSIKLKVIIKINKLLMTERIIPKIRVLSFFWNFLKPSRD